MSYCHVLAGRVIGKQGSGITSIETNSGALLCTVFQEGILVLGETAEKLDSARVLIAKMYEKFLVPAVATSESSEIAVGKSKSNGKLTEKCHQNNNKSKGKGQQKKKK